MKKFKFRLERVLQFRRLVKDEKQRVLLEKRRVVEECRARIKAIENELLAKHVRDQGILTVAELNLAANYVVRLKAALVSAREQLVGAEEEYQAALAEYIQAAKDEKSLVMLKDKKQIEYRELIDKELQKVLDERATMTAARRVDE